MSIVALIIRQGSCYESALVYSREINMATLVEFETSRSNLTLVT